MFRLCLHFLLFYTGLSLSPSASLFSLSPDKPCAVVSRACLYACCVISRYSSSQAMLCCWRFFSSLSLFNRSNLTLHLCPGQSLQTSTSGSTLQVKKVQKNFKNNYASVECGAKILSANSEAKVRNTPPLSPPAYTQPCTLTMSRFIPPMFTVAANREALMYQLKIGTALLTTAGLLPDQMTLIIWVLRCYFRKNLTESVCPISRQR